MQELAQEFNKLGEGFYNNADYEKALVNFLNALNFDPDNVHSLNNIGVVLSKLGRYEEAEGYFKNAISRDPTFFEAFNNLGNLMRLMGFHINAERYLDISLQINPDYEGALLNLGLVTEDIGNLKKSYESNEKAYKISKRPGYLAHMYYLKRKMCDWQGLKDLSKRLDKNIRKKGETPFINLIRSNSESKNLKLAKVWSKRSPRYTRDDMSLRGVKATKQSRLKIGYISETFRDHPVGHCIHEIFKYHNKKKFDVYTYSYGVDDASIFRKNVELNSKFFDIRKFNIQEAVQLIKSHDLNILIDLQGLTKDNRIEILEAYAAKIQVSYLGYPGPSGSDIYDYLITDKIAIPKSSQKFYTEKIIYLDRAYQINSSLKISKEKISKKDFDLPEDKIIFCSFNRSVKIEQKMFDIWLAILKKVPNSVLWLYLDNGYEQANLLKHAVTKGIEADRIIFSGRTSIDKHLARLRLADIALDTSIYSGGATTANALQVGLPVVTLRGKHYLSRMSESLLYHIKTRELIASDITEYQRVATKLANDKVFYKKTQDKIIKNRHLIFDTKSFTKDFENLLITLCKSHLN